MKVQKMVNGVKKRFRAFGNIYLKFEPIKGLNFRTQFSPQMLNKRNGEYYGMWCKNGGAGKPTIQVPYMKPTTIGDMYGTIKRLMTNVSET